MKILIAVLLISSFLSSCNRRPETPQRGKTIETWETSGKTFKIRVTEYDEKNPILLTNFHFVFEAASLSSNEWHEIMEDHVDDDMPIPRDKVRFLNDQTAYVFLNSVFAATVDSGHTWKVWDAKKNVPDWQCCNQAFIKDVSITADGKGRMTLGPRFNDIKVKELHTKDYGITWTAPDQ
jgi:hypothetical protein